MELDNEDDPPSKFEKHGKTIQRILKDELTKLTSKAGISGTTTLHQHQIEAVTRTAEHFKEKVWQKRL